MDTVLDLHLAEDIGDEPCPLILANDNELYVAYYLDEDPDELEPERVGLVVFPDLHIFRFGAPNDEAINGHPLYQNGLEPYGSYEVQQSSWLEQLREMNRVHPDHSDGYFNDMSHFVWTFQDSTLDVVAADFEFTVHEGSPFSVIGRVFDQLEQDEFREP